MAKRLIPVFASLMLLASSSRGWAQQAFQTLGPNECLNCHDHDAERQWYEKKEIPEVQRLFPDRNATAGHINSLKQLEAPKSKEFADAIGLKDKYDLSGPCVGCHATVFAGDANAGVSCESCHGPSSGYLKPHQQKGAYDISVAQYGMTRLVGNIQGWTQQCSNCHIQNDERLIKAGHPSGDDFDLGKKFLPVSIHFKKKYEAAEVGAIAAAEMAGIIRRRRPGAAPAATAAAPPQPAAAPAAAANAGAPSTPQPAASPAVAAPERSVAAVAPVQPRAPLASPNAAAPPPGSPTSIEPVVPILETVPAGSMANPVNAPQAAAPPSVPAVSLPAPASQGSSLPWIIGVVVVLAIGALFLMRRGK